VRTALATKSGQPVSQTQGESCTFRRRIERMHWCARGEIRLVLGTHESDAASGIVQFSARPVWNAKDVAPTKVDHELNALDAICDEARARGRKNCAPHFGCGTSNEDDGQILNAEVYRFKSKLSGGDLAREFSSVEY
jgi:hypothetical protein